MEINIYDYVSEDELSHHKEIIQDKERKNIYDDGVVKISIVRKGKRTYTFVDKFGDKKLNDALNEMVKLV
jgi:hypothetical protein